jgi:hypothetical protein
MHRAARGINFTTGPAGNSLGSVNVAFCGIYAVESHSHGIHRTVHFAVTHGCDPAPVRPAVRVGTG